jgi:DNA-binding transcriptional MerR regulator
MAAGLTVGDFSRATHLSVKTLRHYHQVGLLQPTTVNPGTGYRYYSAHQIPTAQVIRRLRDLEMPVADVKAVLAAPDAPARNARPHRRAPEPAGGRTGPDPGRGRVAAHPAAAAGRPGRDRAPQRARHRGGGHRGGGQQGGRPGRWQGALGELRATIRA